MMTLVFDLIINTFIASTVFFAGYIGNSYFLLNSPHGAIEAWHARIARLHATISSERVELGLRDQVCRIQAPITPDEQVELNTFLAHHLSLQRAAERLELIKRRSIFLLLSVLVGLSVGMLVSVPPFFGVESISQKYPLLPVFFGLFSSLLFVGLVSWPQAAAWNELRDATPD